VLINMRFAHIAQVCSVLILIHMVVDGC
jgi:hypothetical protein